MPILHYLYSSQLHIFAENVREIMRTARKLQILSVLNVSKFFVGVFGICACQKVGLVFDGMVLNQKLVMKVEILVDVYMKFKFDYCLCYDFD